MANEYEGASGSITFGTSGTTINALTIQAQGVSREAIEKTVLSTTGGKLYIPGARYDPGTIDVTHAYDPDTQPPFSAVTETITITYPSTKANGATAASSGFITNFDEGNMEGDTLGVASFTVKRSGVITYTDAST